MWVKQIIVNFDARGHRLPKGWIERIKCNEKKKYRLRYVGRISFVIGLSLFLRLKLLQSTSGKVASKRSDSTTYVIHAQARVSLHVIPACQVQLGKQLIVHSVHTLSLFSGSCGATPLV